MNRLLNVVLHRKWLILSLYADVLDLNRVKMVNAFNFKIVCITSCVGFNSEQLLFQIYEKFIKDFEHR